MQTDFQLGEWIVRPRRDCIERGRRIVHVKPKSMAVLEQLIRTPGEAVTRTQIFNAVWPGGAVTDDVLTQCIMELRKAFGDSAHHPRYIETIPKVGFRLLPQVTPLRPVAKVADDASVTSRSGVWKPATRVLLIVVSTLLLGLVFFWYLSGSRSLPPSAEVTGIKTLAVLPFVDISETQDQEWYAYGLTEELINRLAQLEGLQVTGRTASYHFEGSDEDPKSIARILGVRHLLEGSVRTDADSVRITAQLIDAENGFHAWSRQFDRPRTEILGVQEEIAEEVAAALSIELAVGKLGILPGGTGSVEAYELLMLSKKYQWENSPESIIQAIDLVKQAIEIDPDYARAWLRLSGLYINANDIFMSSAETDWRLLSRQALQQARSLEPDLSDVKFLTMITQYQGWDWAGVEQTMDRGAGLELSSDFNLLSGWSGFLIRVGRIQESVRYLKRQRRLNPWSINTALALGLAYVIQGRVEEGLSEAERAFELEGFKQKSVLNGLQLALAVNDRELLLKWLARAEQYLPQERPLIEAMSETLGDREAALAWLRVTFQRTDEYDYLITHCAAWYGDQDLALDAMERQPVPWAFWDIHMREVRQNPRFKDLVRRVGLEAYFREFGWNDFCRPVDLDDFECDR